MSAPRGTFAVVRRGALGLATLGLAGVLAGLLSDAAALWRPAAVVASVGAAVGIGALPALRGYQFTVWIVAAVVAAMLYPARFLTLGPLDLRHPWLILLIVQLVMFGMGTQMRLADFLALRRMSRGLLVGVALQFTVMPVVGFLLATSLGFPAEIAAGIVLIGSCSSGLASNVMAYLARANLALSVTLTAASTLLAPLLTPLWMKSLAGAMVEIDLGAMMGNILRMVLVPIGAALLHDYLKHASARARALVRWCAGAGAAWLALLAGGGFTLLAAWLPAALVGAAGFLAGAVVAGVVFNALAQRLPRLEAAMPRVSMFGIVYFTAVATAAGRDELLAIGALLFAAAIAHNLAGYLLGYWLSRGLGLDRQSARTVALEVGLQNGAMASGLAGSMGKLGTMGLAAAIFSPWMNVSGSVLANHWRRRPVEPAADGRLPDE